jgi:hypothetical protein
VREAEPTIGHCCEWCGNLKDISDTRLRRADDREHQWAPRQFLVSTKQRIRSQIPRGVVLELASVNTYMGLIKMYFWLSSPTEPLCVRFRRNDLEVTRERQ